MIGDDVTVTVVRVAGGGVRLGIQAPSDYVIVRDELQGSELPASERAESGAPAASSEEH